MSEDFRKFFRENFLVFLFGFLGLVFLTVGTISLFLGSQNKESEIIIEEGEGMAAGKIKVDVEGAVVSPGVYEFSGEPRVQEALISAGGLSSSANRDWVTKNLNLAAKLTDGAKIYIPQKNESPLRPAEQGFAGQAGIDGGTEGEKISINNATLEELDRLPGVGPVTAQKIIAGRPYQTLEELISKKVVGESTFSKIKEQIIVW